MARIVMKDLNAGWEAGDCLPTPNVKGREKELLKDTTSPTATNGCLITSRYSLPVSPGACRNASTVVKAGDAVRPRRVARPKERNSRGARGRTASCPGRSGRVDEEATEMPRRSQSRASMVAPLRTSNFGRMSIPSAANEASSRSSGTTTAVATLGKHPSRTRPFAPVQARASRRITSKRLNRAGAMSGEPELTLDPADWDAFRTLAIV